MASAGTIVAEPSAQKKGLRAASAIKTRAGRNQSDADDDRAEIRRVFSLLRTERTSEPPHRCHGTFRGPGTSEVGWCRGGFVVSNCG